MPKISNGKIVYGASTSAPGGLSQFYIERTDGQVLVSLSQMQNQVSLKPHTFNTGNYYNYFSNINNSANTICPTGWSLPLESIYPNISIIYNLHEIETEKDSAFLNMPFQFIKAGCYKESGNIEEISNYGYFRGNITSLQLHPKYINIAATNIAARGYLIRCVAR